MKCSNPVAVAKATIATTIATAMATTITTAALTLAAATTTHAQDDTDLPLSSPDIAGAILMVVTSTGEMHEGEPTGLWLEEFAIPYDLFHEAGYMITVASPNGGTTPIDPRSLADTSQAAPDTDILRALETTTPLADVDLNQFDAVFFPGGHGTMFDLPGNESVQQTVAHFIAADQPAAFVCHGPAALVGATFPDGTSVVKGRRITGFTDAEERAVELDDEMPFLLETRLRELGGQFVGSENFQEHVVTDGNLITGQNPASSEVAARELLKALQVGGS